MAVLARVYEDIVVFHILNIIGRGILVEDIIDAFRNQLFHFLKRLIETVVEARKLDAFVFLVRKKKEGLVGCDFVNDPLDTLLVIPIPVVICAIRSGFATVSVAVLIEGERKAVVVFVFVRDISSGKTCMIVLVDALCHAVFYCGDRLFQGVLLAD